MRSIHVIFIIFLLNFTNSEVPARDQQLAKKGEKKISEYILKLLDHYKQDDPVGIPDAPIPDPLPIPPLSHSFSVGKMNFKDVKLYGLTKFRIQSIKADIKDMKLETALTIKVLNVYGNYTLSTWLSKAHGPFTIKLTDVYAQANATLEVQQNGQLEANDMSMDLTFKDMVMDFKGLGFFANMFQGVINSVGTFVFDSIKPFVLREVNTNMRKDVNEQVRKIPQKFPNSISPLDQLIIDIRHKCRQAKIDPYQVNDYNKSVGIFDVYMTQTWLYGLSSIHRVGDVVFEVKNGTVFALLEVGTQKLEGKSNWEVSLMAGVVSQAGTVDFTVEYFRVQVNLSQTMDTRNSPKLEDIQLELGNIQIRFDGAGTIDYAIELLVNVLPNLLRYQIMDALEEPVKRRCQEELNRFNVEEKIKENVEKIDKPGAIEFL